MCESVHCCGDTSNIDTSHIQLVEWQMILLHHKKNSLISSCLVLRLVKPNFLAAAVLATTTASCDEPMLADVCLHVSHERCNLIGLQYIYLQHV